MATKIRNNEAFPKVSELYASALDSTPVIVSGWNPEKLEWMGSRDADDAWSFWEANRCDKCRRAVVGGASGAGSGKHSEVADVSDCECANPDRHEADCVMRCEGHIGAFEGPMMNYWYPLELSDPVEVATRIADLPLCVVEVAGAHGLALTGGGMNMVWYICEAFMRAGYLPPVYFATQLPAMADKPRGPKDAWVIAGCKRSLTAQMGRLREGIKHIDGLKAKSAE